MNAWAIVLLTLIGLASIRGFGQLFTGRRAIEPPDDALEAVVRVVVYLAMVAAEILLVLAAVGVIWQ